MKFENSKWTESSRETIYILVQEKIQAKEDPTKNCEKPAEENKTATKTNEIYV